MDEMEEVAGALAEVRALREQMIVLRRNETSLPAQSFRVERVTVSRSIQFRSEASKERRADVIIMGAVDADIEMNDLFNGENGTLYKVNFIQPNRSVMTLAEAVIVA